MKLKETFLCFLLLLLAFFDLSIPNFSFALATRQTFASDYSVDYISTDIGNGENLIAEFVDTPLVQDNALNINYLLNTEIPVKTDLFELYYDDLASLTKETIFKLSKVKINADIDKVTVEGNERQSTVTMNVSIKLNKQTALTKLIGIKSDNICVSVGANIGLDKKSVSTFFEIEDLDLSPFVMRIACSYLFGEKDFDKFARDIVYKIVWNLGTPCSFGKDSLKYNL